ncbi:peptidase [Reichenbachiella sp. 5M10]|uniref:carboxylesterase family protein n=1 Tax=Reichenbachiella sp. 5M10 TaxID=1889772 RepID=UPI000C14D24E|nr:prolyl oligopeptidase family serine peptidase [Reichenbachiella sp. 5M10]PIB36736.1 peptidase [Reichenbachiella sp. 5M10]
MKTNYLLLLALLTCVACHPPTPSPERLETIPYISDTDQSERNYYLYIPKGYDSEDKDWPVILFLHGNGERGNGQEELAYTMAHGPIYEAWVQRRDLPFLMIMPQLHMFGLDTLGIPYLQNRDLNKAPKRLKSGTPQREAFFTTHSPMNGQVANDSFPYQQYGPMRGWEMVEKDLLHMIAQVKDEYRVDESKIYLSGLSYGGFGTWYMGSKHPDLFAAIHPVVGWGHPDLMPSLAHHQTPIWCFAGGRDEVIKVEYFYPGMNALDSLGHRQFKFTTEEDLGHDTWKRVYAGEDIYNWMLSQSKQ